MVNSTDFDSIKRQLGRTPQGEFEVICYAPTGDVQVIKSRPFLAGKPFPNLYWLVCEKLKYAIDRIEASGWVKRLEEEILPVDDSLARRLELDHYRYMRSRWAYVRDEDLFSLASLNYLRPLSDTGIGGISDFKRVRCLHMHYAFHLAEKSALGEWLDERFNLKEVYAPRFELSL